MKCKFIFTLYVSILSTNFYISLESVHLFIHSQNSKPYIYTFFSLHNNSYFIVTGFYFSFITFLFFGEYWYEFLLNHKTLEIYLVLKVFFLLFNF